ncbi:hypothetical protein ISS37_05540 [candidate division KSB1 bacterium]|nr:hypothetical protein [candidate division KSB1 bacterium]
MKKSYEKELVWCILEGMIADGTIDPSEKTPEELHLIIKKYFEKYLPKLNNIRFEISIDHISDILNNAREFRNLGKPHLSCLLYAVWTEHWINGIISSVCRRQGIKYSVIKDIIRSVSFIGKITWLLEIFNFKPLHNDHKLRMLQLMEHRNAFVHYKWKYFDPDQDDSNNDDITKILEDYDKTVKYLKSYQSKYILMGTKSKIRSMIKKKKQIKKQKKVKSKNVINGTLLVEA